MWLLRLMEIIWIICIQLFPIFLDTGIQVWNGITISQMPTFVKNGEWKYEELNYENMNNTEGNYEEGNYTDLYDAEFVLTDDSIEEESFITTIPSVTQSHLSNEILNLTRPSANPARLQQDNLTLSVEQLQQENSKLTEMFRKANEEYCAEEHRMSGCNNMISTIENSGTRIKDIFGYIKDKLFRNVDPLIVESFKLVKDNENKSFKSSDIDYLKETNTKLKKLEKKFLSEKQSLLRQERRKREAPCTTEECILRENIDKENKERIIEEYVVYGDITFKITQEAVVSIALLQLPAVCLSTFGIMRSDGWIDRLLALLLIFVPFFFVEVLVLFEFYHEGLQSIIDKVKDGVGTVLKFLFGESSKKLLNLLHFLPANDATRRDRTLCVKVAKMFFGSCLQLCYQIVLLVGYTDKGDRELTQYLSIAASAIPLCMVGVDIILFRRNTVEEESEEKKRFSTYVYLILTNTSPPSTCAEKLKASIENCKAFIKKFLIEKFAQMKTFVYYLPLVLTSLMFNTGTLVLAILVLDWYSAIYIGLVFAANLMVSLILPFDFVKAMEHKLGLQYKFDKKNFSKTEMGKGEVVNGKVLRGVLISWTNIFFMSRPVETCSYFRTIHMVLLQIFRFIINIITVIVLIVYTTQNSIIKEWLKTNLEYCFICLIFTGIANIFLVFVYTYQFNYGGDTKQEPTTESEKSEIAPLTALDLLENGNIADVDETEEAKNATGNFANVLQDEGGDWKIQKMVITRRVTKKIGDSPAITTETTNTIVPSALTPVSALDSLENGNFVDIEETDESKNAAEKWASYMQDEGDGLTIKKTVITRTLKTAAGNSDTTAVSQNTRTT